MGAGTQDWLDRELAGSSFVDERLGKRLRKLVELMGNAIGSTVPLACQDWANTKAAYRFFSNDRVSEAEILAGHFEATRDRFDATEGPILVLQDTTEFTFQREHSVAVGITYSVNSGKDKAGRYRMHTVCGLLMHSSLAVTTDGLPLGLAAIKFWNRQKFKGTAALKRKINPTRLPIEQKESFRWLENMRQSIALFGAPERCIHVGDRESDIYELFCLAEALGTHFLVRTCVDRLAGDGNHTIADEMRDLGVAGLHHVEVANDAGRVETANVEIKYGSIHVLPPIGKQKRYPALTLTVLHAREREEPAGRPRIDWKLITDLPVQSHRDAVEKLHWYALRWKILSWRVFWLTMINRSLPQAEPDLVLTKLEIKLLDQLVPNRGTPPTRTSLSKYLTKIARLGGYLARANDPPPGNTVMWRGLARLTDIKLGATLAGVVGN